MITNVRRKDFLGLTIKGVVEEESLYMTEERKENTS